MYIKKFIKLFFSKQFLMFLVLGLVNTFNGTWIAFVYSLFITNVNISFICGYLTSLVIGFFLNSYFVFKEKTSFANFIKFAISYIPNFIIQNLGVYVMYNILQFPKIIAFALAAAVAVPITFLLLKVFAFGKKSK